MMTTTTEIYRLDRRAYKNMATASDLHRPLVLTTIGIVTN